MTQVTINVGAQPNDRTGDPLRTAFQKCNTNANDAETRLSALESAPGGGGEAAQQIAFDTEIPFDADSFMDDHFIAGPLEFTIAAVTPVLGASCVVTVFADGVNIPTFVDMLERSGSSAYVNTLNQLNQIVFWFDGARYWYTISSALGGFVEEPPDETPPVLQTAVVQNAAPTQVILTYDEDLDEASGSAAAYAFSGGRTVSGIEVDGATVTVTITPAYAFGDVITFSYTPGTPPLQDVDGNDAAALTNQAVTNNVSPVATAVTFSAMDRMTGPVSEVYTATSAGTSSTAQAVTGLVLPAGEIGWIECQRPVTGPPSTVSSVIGLDAANSGFATFGTNDLIGSISAAGLISYGENTASLTSTGYTLPEGPGSRIRLYRDAANVVTLQSTEDDGATWTVRRTFPGTHATDLIPHFYTTFSTTARTLQQPRAFNLVAP